MKIKKLLTPILTISALSALAPCVSLASCGNNQKQSGKDITDNGVTVVDGQEIKTVNSYTTLETKFAKMPDGKKASVALENVSGNKIDVIFDESSTNSPTVITVSVGDDKTASVKVKFVDVPPASVESKFNLIYSFTIDGKAQTANIKNCVLKYTISDELVDVSSGYQPQQTPKASWAATTKEEFYQEYIDDAFPEGETLSCIFNDDYLYSAAKQINDHPTYFTNLKAATKINNIKQVNPNKFTINVTIKFSADKVEVDAGWGVFTFTNINVDMCLSTVYNYEICNVAKEGSNIKIFIDDVETNALTGTFSGAFNVNGTAVDYEGEIGTQYMSKSTPQGEASFLSANTLGFLFGDGDVGNLYFYSPYSTNYVPPVEK